MLALEKTEESTFFEDFLFSFDQVLAIV